MKPEEVNELTPEAVRQEAEARQITLEPTNPDITPDEEPAAVQAARHANGPAIANASNDTEQNAALIQPAPALRSSKQRPPLSRHTKTAALTTLIFLMGAVAAIIIYALA